MADAERLSAAVSRAVLEQVAGSVSDVKAEIGRRLHEMHLEEGGRRDPDSSQTLVKRAFADGPERGLTREQARELLALLGFTGADAVRDFVAEHLSTDVAQLTARLHEAFRLDEEKACHHRDHEPGFETRDVVGSVIELRRFFGQGGRDWRWGIAAEKVMLDDTGYRLEPGPGLQFTGMRIDGRIGEKRVLHDILPADLEDAQDGTVTLRLASTDYAVVRQCDPSIYDDYGGKAVYEAEGRRIDNGMRAANRLSFGKLTPRFNRVPYCLTLFYTLLLADKKVLFMRRSPEVQWFPNAVELSGGEQLKPEYDLLQPQPFAAWIKRAIREEYLVGMVADDGERRAFEAAFYGKGYLSAVGFDSVTCSVPLFALCESRCTERDYLDLYLKGRSTIGSRAPDNEGAIAILTFEEVARLMRRGKARGRVLRIDADRQAAFVVEGSERSLANITLSPTDLHPMTAYRLRLLAETVLT